MHIHAEVRLFNRIASFCMLFFLGLGSASAAQSLDEKLSRPFPFASSDQPVDLLVGEFSRRNALPVNLSEELSGSVAVRNQRGTGRDFLDLLSSSVNATWWHNGVVVFIEPIGSIKSKSFDLTDLSVDELHSELGAMGLRWDQYPISKTKNRSLVRISGPTEYLLNVSDFLDDLMNAKRGDAPKVAGASTQPKIYFGQTPASVPTPSE